MPEPEPPELKTLVADTLNFCNHEGPLTNAIEMGWPTLVKHILRRLESEATEPEEAARAARLLARWDTCFTED